MAKKDQPTPPQPPDPNEIIQTQANVNRINQQTPFGSLTFSGPNRSTATLELDPAIQNLFQQQIGIDTGLLGTAEQALPGIEGLIQDPLSTGGLPQISTPLAPDQLDPFREDISEEFFERSSGLLDEQFQREEERLRQTLANQGLQAGGEAFGQELGTFNQRRGETFENLARDAVLFGGQEASRALADRSRALRNQGALRSQVFGERGAVRGNQFNELASLLGLQQVQQPGLQNFFAPGAVNAVDPFALEQQGQQSNFGIQSQRAGQAKGGAADLIGTLGSAGILASDRRLKTDIERIGIYKGYPWYLWTWNEEAERLGFEGKGIGVMADEVPNAILKDGYWHVDYGAL